MSSAKSSSTPGGVPTGEGSDRDHGYVGLAGQSEIARHDGPVPIPWLTGTGDRTILANVTTAPGNGLGDLLAAVGGLTRDFERAWAARYSVFSARRTASRAMASSRW
jgi:hypothetical protein